MSTHEEEEDENDVPLTEDEIEELMVQVNRQVAKKLKQRDEQLLSLKTMTGFMKSGKVLSTATNDAVKKDRLKDNHKQTTSQSI